MCPEQPVAVTQLGNIQKIRYVDQDTAQRNNDRKRI